MLDCCVILKLNSCSFNFATKLLRDHALERQSLKSLLESGTQLHPYLMTSACLFRSTVVRPDCLVVGLVCGGVRTLLHFCPVQYPITSGALPANFTVQSISLVQSQEVARANSVGTCMRIRKPVSNTNLE